VTGRRDPTLDVLLDLDRQVLVVDPEGGYWVRFVVTRVPASVEKPHGIDTSLTLHGPEGERLVGFGRATAARCRIIVIGCEPSGPGGQNQTLGTRRDCANSGQSLCATEPIHIDGSDGTRLSGSCEGNTAPRLSEPFVALDGSGGQSRATVLRYAIAGKANAREAESGTTLPIAKSMQRSIRDGLPRTRKKDGAYPFAPLPSAFTRCPIEDAVG